MPLNNPMNTRMVAGFVIVSARVEKYMLPGLTVAVCVGTLRVVCHPIESNKKPPITAAGRWNWASAVKPNAASTP
jgi:hypothetical protein